jgi:restriction system protein
VLESSDHDEVIPKSWDLAYDPETKTIIVDYDLPTPDDLPTLKTVRYVKSTGELKETRISAKEQKDLYDELCFQICLRTVHELFEADTFDHLERIVFNGQAEYIDKATGQRVRSTIISLMTTKPEFSAVNLAAVEPRACFKSLKGVSAASLVGLTPVAPIMQFDKEDKRFVDAQDVVLSEDGATNLAAMNWEEFEHLVRDIFDKEFASRGGEVRVTQSSSDGGVDAIGFDPDPISGGKVVIQAKRYTKTVGVNAVRDLYGTTLNEGAIKGILVTTSDFGPDAHKFASDKPLTLMTGSHLLHLLEKHGVKAKIDLMAARKELGLKG